ncbi:MAG TPA: GAF domain-containing protein [Methylomirabilota bacterium]|nr:GAF domain-containing protein [Methylomirabilota bacterium]
MTKPERERTLKREAAARKRETAARKRAEVQRDALRARLEEALEQQTATAEILRVISSSPTDIQAVLATVAERAARLCDSFDAAIFRVHGDTLRLAAHHGSIPPTGSTTPLVRGFVNGRAVLERREIHLADLQAEADEFPEGSAEAKRVGWRTTLAVPLMRENTVIGTIAIRRTEVRPFSMQQIDLVKTFADQAVIAIENARLFKELEARNSDLSEALEQQTATSEILGVISSSPADVQPVFAAVLANAARLCDASDATMFRVEGVELHLVAHDGPIPAHGPGRFPLVRGTPPGRIVLDRRTVHVADLQAEADEFPEGSAFARLLGFRTILGVPLLRGGEAIGAITVRRADRRLFADRQVKLLELLADQAVIAIENVRLFNETKEALERQTATSEILRVISSSPTDTQPVFDIIAANAARLCAARDAQVLRVEGGVLRLVSAHGSASMPPVRALSRGHAVGRAIIDRQTIHVRDRAQAIAEFPETSAPQHGVESFLAVPLVREDVAVGVIRISRTQLQPFTEQQIALVQTFADQAVIAIENVRLFTELQEKNRALTHAHAQVTEALEQQTATSEILRVISGIHTDTQPVFDTIVQSAVRLCKAATAAVFLTDGRMLYEPANYGSSSEVLAVSRARYPRPLDMDTTGGIAVLTKSVVHVPDTEDPLAIEWIRQSGRLVGFRSVVTVPMLREGDAVGAILVTRRQPGPFSDTEVKLLKTFADQAVIAVENVRLFKELEARTAALTRSVEQLTALGEVGRAVSSTLDLETVLTTIVSRAVQLSGLDGGVVLEYEEGVEEFVQRAQAETGGALAAARRATRIRKGEGVVGRTAVTLEPVQVPDITVPGAYVGPNRENLIESGIRAIVAVPMVREGRLIGCLGVTRNRPGAFPAETIELLRTFATQSALAIQNARLFHEIEDKSRQLEAASRHKSEFLANMSHELRTPLNAIIGFSEVLGERMFGELNAKQDEYVKDVHASGQHLLSLINDILDLSKIEAGRMELELSEFHLPAALENALTLVRERAGRHGIALHTTVDERVGQVRADERKIRQVVLNLLSNAIKFTPEGGRIDVRAVPGDGGVEISVSDTGVGIAPEDQEAIFEEFRQVGTAAKQVEGTGLGLALSRKFIELHGGRIWVQSQVGLGSTFTFTVPVPA